MVLMMNAIKQSDRYQSPALVVGLGKTGWSVVRYLCDQHLPVVVTDTREIPPFLAEMRARYPHVEFLPGMPAEEYNHYEQVIVSPGVAAVSERAVGDVELFLREAKAPVIAITGSNGKSTVTMLVSEMLSAGGHQVLTGGNIGTPALDLLSEPTPDFYVLELSSFQLETTYSLRPASSVVLNISEDHMDRYDDLRDYVEAKQRIYHQALAVVVNRHDELASGQFDSDTRTTKISFGLDQPQEGQFGVVEIDQINYLACGTKLLAPASRMAMRGEQNWLNILAAFALIKIAGIELSEEIISAGLVYPGLPHRCEVVGEYKNVAWVNDSKGTNVGATLAAIEGASKPLILIAGGQGKGADFSALGNAIDNHCKSVILIGEDANKIAATVNQQGKVRHASSLEQAVELAASVALQDDTVLFSPACASFDMFNSYEHRGDRFRELVTLMMRGDSHVR